METPTHDASPKLPQSHSVAPKGMLANLEGRTSAIIFASRWLQVPLYVGLAVAQAVYVIIFVKELIHLVLSIGGPDEEAKIMLTVLGLIDVVMISNLLIMVIIGGYQTFVARLKISSNLEKPEWLSHTNENTMKIKLSMALIGISSISLLRSYIDVEHSSNESLMWKAILHGMFLLSSMAIAATVWISNMATQVGHHEKSH
jgi:uncharacterized protein (TIGR00645 family)